LDNVQGIVGSGVHARTLFDRFEPFEDADRPFGILGCGGWLLGCHGREL